MSKNKYMKIEDIFQKSLMEELTPEEEKILKQFLREHPEWRQVFDRVKMRDDLRKFYDIYQQVDITKAWSRNRRLRDKGSRRYFLGWVAGIAASIVILFGILLFMTRQSRQEEIPFLAETGMRVFEQVGQSANVQVVVDTNVYVIQDTSDLKEQEHSLKTVEQTLQVRVGNGNIFRFKLPDGSEICLNAQSKVTYPGRFDDKFREICIEGEAFLQIVKDSLRPFIVTCGSEAAIKVLGTSFNIKAYPDDKESFVTLVDGCIQFYSGRDSVRLVPSQQVVVDRQTGHMELHAVDPGLYTSWISNRFSFKYETLENISKELARWYGVNFRFEDHAQKRFSGGFSKYDHIEKILHLLAETTQINFVIQDNCIVVK